MKRLRKSPDRMISGVLGGFADYVNVDVTVVRLVFVVVAIMTGLLPFLLAYVIAAAIMPSR